MRMRTLGALALAAIAALALAACGSSSSSSSDAKSLLTDTFSGAHPVNSGQLNIDLTVTPSGSSTLTSPISLSFGGPFQSLGKGKLPKSNFNISLSSGGKSGSLGLLSTGTNGYVTLQGTSYALPAATFKKLESSFSQLASSPGSGGSGSGTLAKLGIHPLNWLSNPSVIGSENMGGTDTTHIRASVNVAALLVDVDTFLRKASSAGVSGTSQAASGLSATTRQKIAGEVRSPTFDVWTGKSDRTVRKLAIQLSLPVTGQISTQLGGLSSAAIGLTMKYSDLNQPQTISAPTKVRPYSEFSSKLQTFLASIQGSLGGAASSGSTDNGSTGSSSGGAGSSSGSTGSSSGSTGSSSGSTGSSTAGQAGASSAVQRYSQCIVNAKNDVTKMQKCARLINGQ
jgi:hypothetical protein